jgi:hypothetical protein
LLTFTGAVRQQDGLSPSAAFVGTGTFDALTQAIFHALNDTAPHTHDSVFDNIAKSMTRVIRTSNSSAPVAIGQATAIQLFVRIEWPWISLPVALLFLCLLCLVVIIIHTSARNVPNWKDNVLATLVYGIHDEGRRAFEKLNDEGDMEDAAKKLMVRLENGEGGWSLMKQSLYTDSLGGTIWMLYHGNIDAFQSYVSSEQHRLCSASAQVCSGLLSLFTCLLWLWLQAPINRTCPPLL